MTEQKTPLLQVRHLNVEFHTSGGVVHAVTDVSFDLYEGEVLGIVGESGSGKSVTAKSIMRLLPDTAKVSGTILLNGRDVSKIREKEFNKIRGKDISMIFQDPMTSLNPVYTVGNQLEETLKIHMGMNSKQAHDRALELLNEVSIPQPEMRLKEYPDQFSGGMRQRVMIAMAMACNPSILIADEPTTALDVTIQAQILDLMRKLMEDYHTAIILITHDLGIVAGMANRINVMYGSQIMESADCDDLFYETSHPYTRGLLECLPERAENMADKQLHPIPGSPVDLMMLPEGCAFASRCENCMKLCLKRKPDLFPAGQGKDHTSRCWLTGLQIEPWKEQKA